MPLGFERLNERTTRPNPLVNFIKPLPGSTTRTAQDFLERIAAQCYPVMKANYLAVMSLEEYEWNPEFIGRNFNAGEVIQLVLRSRSGNWLPFKHVQMVMMHELAHCKQMNHSSEFWKVRNAYAEEMRGLWGRNYLGEGLWGRGHSLESGAFMNNRMPETSEMPEHMCGGTYRRRGRKRKRKGAVKESQQLSYAERKQRRILKKFGAGGVALGDDEETRVKLEDGKRPKGKPRVAGSARGRELRAAAALARFEKANEEEIKEEETTDSDTESETEFDWPPTDDEAAVRRDGKDFVRICAAEDEQDDNVKREMEELYDLNSIPKAPPDKENRNEATAKSTSTGRTKVNSRTIPKTTSAPSKPKPKPKSEGPVPKPPPSKSSTSSHPTLSSSFSNAISATKAQESAASQSTPSSKICAACSLSNEPDALLCIACSNVLDPSRMPNHWRCHSLSCRGGVYINMGDYGRCQICGAARS